MGVYIYELLIMYVLNIEIIIKLKSYRTNYTRELVITTLKDWLPSSLCNTRRMEGKINKIKTASALNFKMTARRHHEAHNK